MSVRRRRSRQIRPELIAICAGVEACCGELVGHTQPPSAPRRARWPLRRAFIEARWRREEGRTPAREEGRAGAGHDEGRIWWGDSPPPARDSPAALRRAAAAMSVRCLVAWNVVAFQRCTCTGVDQKLHIRPLLVSAGKAQGLAARSKPPRTRIEAPGRQRVAGWSRGGARARARPWRRVAMRGSLGTWYMREHRNLELLTACHLSFVCAAARSRAGRHYRLLSANACAPLAQDKREKEKDKDERESGERGGKI
uniref:Uncharacterized protein n=1 Tax=Oryza glumipatula TaxID=40148 RepID=A0A0E0AV77_9ORYZ